MLENRRFLGFEMDPLHVEVATARIEDALLEKAQLVKALPAPSLFEDIED